LILDYFHNLHTGSGPPKSSPKSSDTLRGRSPGRHSDPPLGGSLCRCDVQRCHACGNHSGLIVKTIPRQREKPFAFPPEIAFTCPGIRTSVAHSYGLGLTFCSIVPQVALR
jgi:hypothetical protein